MNKPAETGTNKTTTTKTNNHKTPKRETITSEQKHTKYKKIKKQMQ